MLRPHRGLPRGTHRTVRRTEEIYERPATLRQPFVSKANFTVTVEGPPRG